MNKKTIVFSIVVPVVLVIVLVWLYLSDPPTPEQERDRLIIACEDAIDEFAEITTKIIAEHTGNPLFPEEALEALQVPEDAPPLTPRECFQLFSFCASNPEICYSDEDSPYYPSDPPTPEQERDRLNIACEIASSEYVRILTKLLNDNAENPVFAGTRAYLEEHPPLPIECWQFHAFCASNPEICYEDEDFQPDF